ncbi:MAG: hypothetical protein ACE5DM_00270 [Candidatus Nanoarchaeia archaeon]
MKKIIALGTAAAIGLGMCGLYNLKEKRDKRNERWAREDREAKIEYMCKHPDAEFIKARSAAVKDLRKRMREITDLMNSEERSDEEVRKVVYHGQISSIKGCDVKLTHRFTKIYRNGKTENDVEKETVKYDPLMKIISDPYEGM